jgi:hypothetical protein
MGHPARIFLAHFVSQQVKGKMKRFVEPKRICGKNLELALRKL